MRWRRCLPPTLSGAFAAEHGKLVGPGCWGTKLPSSMEITSRKVPQIPEVEASWAPSCAELKRPGNFRPMIPGGHA